MTNHADRRFIRAAALLVLAIALPRAGVAQPVLLNAHSHNDYEHTRPLYDALDRGFNSIEADIYLVKGQLLVGHSRDSLSDSRTLESLYLAPLRIRAKEHSGRIYPGPQPLTLLIDVKSNADSTYVVLDSLLRRYSDLFTRFSGNDVTEGPIVAIISGNRAIATMSKAPVRFAAVDGRFPDLLASTRASKALMPLVSDSWEKITKWNGDGPMPANVKSDIDHHVALAHRRGQRLRLWATPDREDIWKLLADAKVDLIGADDLDRLRNFFTNR